MDNADRLQKIQDIDDPAERLAGFAAFVVEAEHLLAHARKLRDQAIKDYRSASDRTVAQIAQVAGVSVATVKAVLR